LGIEPNSGERRNPAVDGELQYEKDVAVAVGERAI
jgi:hypothetical protein